MTETEISRLVVRLVGEDSSFQKMMDRAVKEGMKLERQAQQAARAEDSLNEAMRQGAAVTRSVETEVEKYNRVLQEMSSLHQRGAVSLTTFNRVMKQHEQLLPEFAEATRKAQEAEKAKQDLMERGKGLTREMRTDLERYNDRLLELDKMLQGGAISQRTYNRAAEALRQTLPGNIALEQQRQDAMRRAASLTESLLTPQERYRRSIAEISQLRREDLISQETFNRAIKQSESVLRGAGTAATEFAGKLTSVGSQLVIVGGLVAGSLTAMGVQAIRSAGEFERTTIAFSTMLGSEREAQRLLADLTRFAAETPFEMPEIEQAARGLVQFGERGQELMETLKVLGNAAAGTSTDFGMVALIFNQVRGVGHLLTQDFRQLSTRGILSLQDIAKHYGTTTEAAQRMLSEGRVSFDDLKVIFRSLSAEGGRFANLMEKQSQSVLGKWSTLKDNFNLFLRSIGQQLLGVANKAIDFANSLMTWFSKLSPAMKTAVAYSGALLAALGTVTAATGGLLLVTGGLVSSYAALITAIGVKTAAMTVEASVVAGLMSSTVAATAVTGGLTAATWAYTAGAAAGKVASMAYGVALLFLQEGAVAATASLVKLTAAAVPFSALIAAPVAVAVVGLYKLYSALQDVNAELQKSEKLTDKLNNLKMARVDRTIEAGSKLGESGDRETFFSRAVEDAKREAAAAQKQVEMSRAKVKELDTFMNSGPTESMEDAGLQQARSGLRDAEKSAESAALAVKKLQDAALKSSGQGGIKLEIEAVNRVIEETEKKMQAANAEVRAFQNIRNPTAQQQQGFEDVKRRAEEYGDALARNRTRLAELDKLGKLKTTAEFEKAREELDKQLAAVGKTPTEAKVAEFAKQGVDPSLVAKFVQDSKKIEDGQRQADAVKNVDTMIAKLNEEAEAWGKVGNAARIATMQKELDEAFQGAGVGEGKGQAQEKLNELTAALKAQDARKVEDTVKALRQQTEELRLTGAALDVYKFKLQGIQLTPEQVASLQEAHKALDVAQFSRSLEETTRGLREQAATFGMTAEQVAIYKLRLKATTDEQHAQVDAIEKMSKAQRLAEKARQVVEGQKTPQQKVEAEKLELTEMLKEGLLTVEQYDKAIANLGAQADKTGRQIAKAMGVDAAKAGSAEALARINAALEGQTGRFGGLPSKAAAVAELQPPKQLVNSAMAAVNVQKEANFDPERYMGNALDQLRNALNDVNRAEGGLDTDEIDRIFRGMEEQRNVVDQEGRRLSYDTNSTNLVTAMERAKKVVADTQSQLDEQSRLKNLPGRTDLETGEEYSAREASELASKLKDYQQIFANFASVIPLLQQGEGKEPAGQFVVPDVRMDPKLDESKMVHAERDSKTLERIAAGMDALVALNQRIADKEPIEVQGVGLR